MKALILENKVVDLVETEFEVHPSMTWVDATQNCKVGWLFENGQLVDSDKRSAEEKAAEELARLRQVRDKKLRRTDWWASGDRTMTQSQIEYRQALRDITNTYTSVYDVVWPQEPQ